MYSLALIKQKNLNYQRDDSLEILRSDVFKYLEDEELERFVEENLDAYDEFIRRLICQITISY